MLYLKSLVNVIDNSVCMELQKHDYSLVVEANQGALIVECIKVLGKNPKNHARLGMSG